MLEGSGPTEVAELDNSILIQDIFGFQIAVHDSLAVQVLQSSGYLEDNATDSLLVGLEMLDEPKAIDVLKHHEYVVLIGETGILLNDVRVVETVQYGELFYQVLLNFVLCDR